MFATNNSNNNNNTSLSFSSSSSLLSPLSLSLSATPTTGAVATANGTPYGSSPSSFILSSPTLISCSPTTSFSVSPPYRHYRVPSLATTTTPTPTATHAPPSPSSPYTPRRKDNDDDDDDDDNDSDDDSDDDHHHEREKNSDHHDGDDDGGGDDNRDTKEDKKTAKIKAKAEAETDIDTHFVGLDEAEEEAEAEVEAETEVREVETRVVKTGTEEEELEEVEGESYAITGKSEYIYYYILREQDVITEKITNRMRVMYHFWSIVARFLVLVIACLPIVFTALAGSVGKVLTMYQEIFCPFVIFLFPILCYIVAGWRKFSSRGRFAVIVLLIGTLGYIAFHFYFFFTRKN